MYKPTCGGGRSRGDISAKSLRASCSHTYPNIPTQSHSTLKKPSLGSTVAKSGYREGRQIALQVQELGRLVQYRFRERFIVGKQG